MTTAILMPVGGTDAPATDPATDPKSAAFYRGLESDVLARTLWGEARGEGESGMQAVACVILNRVKVAGEHQGPYWWGNNVIQVCQKPYQFSCWNRADPNFRALQAVEVRDLYFATALRIARRALIGVLPDITNGATHYCTKDADPFWAHGQTPCAAIGNHVFYRILK